MAKKKSHPTSAAIIDELILRAARSPGLTLSETTLMEEFAISRPTANKILSDLALRGYAYRGPGRPTVLRPRPESACTAHFLIPDALALDHYALPDNYRVNLRLLRGALAEARQRGCLLSLTQLDPVGFEDDLERILGMAQRPVFIATAVHQYSAFIARARRMNLCVVVFGDQAPCGHSVFVDGSQALLQVLRFTASQGRRRFLMLERFDAHDRTAYKREAFLAATQGMEARVLRLQPGDDLKARLAEALKEDSIDALFGANDSIAIAAARALPELGIEIGPQCALIGYDHSPEAQAYKPSFATVDVPLEEIGRRLVEGAALLAEDPKRDFQVQVHARAVLAGG